MAHNQQLICIFCSFSTVSCACHIRTMFTLNYTEQCLLGNFWMWGAIKNSLLLLHIFLCKSVK